MGGKALKNTATRRYWRDEFFELFALFEQKFKQCFPGVRVALIEAYAQKQSFGDMDVVIEGDKMPDNWHEAINELYGATDSSFLMNKKAMENVNGIGFTTEMLLNRPYSFNLEECQVDILPVPAKQFDFTLKQISFNDMSILLGKVFRSLGVRYSQKGLLVSPLDSQGEALTHNPVTLTLDHAKALRFGGYCPDRYREGFDRVEDIYEYAVSSPFFNPALFTMPHRLNSRERTAIATRDSYRDFSDWCSANSDRLPCATKMSATDARERVFMWFPEAEQQCRVMAAEVEARGRNKKRFNGELVSRLTGLQGQQLGLLIKFMKQDFEGNLDFLAWLETQSDEQLESWIRKRLRAYQQKQDKPPAPRP